MKEKFRIKKHHTLYKWILLGCIALMIPIGCAVINYFINKSLVERKINQVNQFMLETIRYNIDENLGDILETTRYHMLDKDFTLPALNAKDEKRFQSLVLNCYHRMRLTEGSNPDIELILYLREKEYLLSSRTANKIDSIYRSLRARGSITLPLEEWKKKLTGSGKSGFMISRDMSYGNYGKESLVYVTPMQYSGPKEAGYFIASISTEFLDQLMQKETNMGNTIFIVDKENRVIGQYGVKLDLDGRKLDLEPGKEKLAFYVHGEEYVGAFTKSNVTDWRYVVCMPKRVFMKEVNQNRDVNMIIVFGGAVIGMAAVIILQRRNYRSVRRLVNILPEPDSSQGDEFILLEKKLKQLYEDNQSMQDSIESRRQYDRELGLLSAIKGSNNFFRKLGTEELLGVDYQKKGFAFVTVRVDGEDGSSVFGVSMDTGLVCFLINNVTMDILGEEYSYIKTLDGGLLVYLFLIPKDSMETWETVSMEKFQWLNEFFQNRLESDLSITIGKIFVDFEYVESAYAEIGEINEQRYYTQPDGVVRAEEVSTVDFSSSGRLSYYGKRFGTIASEGDLDEGKKLSKELFEELNHSQKPFNTTLYYVLSIVNHVLLESSGLVQSKTVREEALDMALGQMRVTESVSALHHSFSQFLRLICRGADQDNQNSRQLSEDIKQYVREHYTDCNVNISAIAEHIGITPRYMSRIFKEQTGMNLLNYINDVRIERAKVLLKTTAKTVDEIAAETGFANSRTFRRNFQKAAKVTAMNYKNT